MSAPRIGCIGFLGASSIDNTGDVLVGYATRQALRALVPAAAQKAFAPRLPHAFWQHRWDRERGLDLELTPVPPDGPLDWARDLSALIIGGGGLILPEAGFAPFLLGDAGAWDGRVPAAWNALCSQNQPYYQAELAGFYDAVRRCCERLRYVSVRNATTARFVRRCGYDGALHVVPDPAILLDVAPDPDARVEAALAECGVDPRRPLIGVSVGSAIEDPRAAAFFADLLSALGDEARTLGAELVLLPFGRVYGDERFALLAAAALPTARVLRAPLGPLDTWRLVGRLDAYVCTRLHAMLAAFVQDVPFLILDEYLSDEVASSKIREFVAEVGLEPLYLCPLLGRRPSGKLCALLRGGAYRTISFAPARAELQARLVAHYREMATALGLLPR